MHRCLYLANLAKNEVFPNPMVGSLLVHENKIIGEGYHQFFGGPHAEVNAISSVKDTALLADSTLYVNLEPCCHWGKTPPCTDLITRSGIKKVVIGCLDPNPNVAGKGVEKLKEAGIEVITDVLLKDCLNLNQRFFEHISHPQKVKFVLKWAESNDGFIGKSEYGSAAEREISNAIAKRWVHKLRSEVDAIMIGTRTAIADDPLLNNRYWFGDSPDIILLDKELKIPKTAQLFKSDSKICIFNQIKEETTGNCVYLKIDFKQDSINFWQQINDKLASNGIFSVLLEGGAITLQSFLESELEADIYRIKSNKKIEHGIKAPITHLKSFDSFKLGTNTVDILKKYAV